MTKMTKQEKIAYLSKRQDAIAIMTEVIKLRHSIESTNIENDDAVKEALHSYKLVGEAMTKLL